MKIIYAGSELCPALFIQDDKDSEWKNWIFVKHPYSGKFVSIAKGNITDTQEE